MRHRRRASGSGAGPPTDADGSQQGLCFFDFGPDGLITRIADYWPDPYEPPASRAGLTERY